MDVRTCTNCKKEKPIDDFKSKKNNNTITKLCISCREKREKCRKKCIVCKKTQATFNFEGHDSPTHCAKCSEPNMINIKSKKCIVCKKTHATFNFEGETKATHCKKCSEPGMVCIKSKKCIVCKKTQATFNFDGKSPTHCKKCSEPDMIDINHKKCIVCKKTCATFNFEGHASPTHCAKCSEPDMIDIKNKKCIKCKKTRATFNFEGQDIPLYCGKCSDPDMIDIKSKKCIKCKKTQPTFNFEGHASPTHCKKCSEPGMIDIKNKKCIVCKKTQANFNFEGYSPTHCKKCSEPDMIDTRHKMCIDCDEIQPTFNLFGKSAMYCSAHKTKNMFCHPTRKCKDCKEFADCGKTVNNRKHCELHRQEDEIKFFSSQCKSCNITDVIVDENNLCDVCDPEVFKKYKMRKQEEINAFLKINKLDDYISYDKSIESTFKEKCDLKTRPDFLWDCGTHFLVLEVDENQHISYGCDVPRMQNMSQVLGMPTLFIRYNPDDFRVNNKKSRISDNSRKVKLINWIQYVKKSGYKMDGYCTYINLFYDEYTNSDVKQIIINKFD